MVKVGRWTGRQHGWQLETKESGDIFREPLKFGSESGITLEECLGYSFVKKCGHQAFFLISANRHTRVLRLVILIFARSDPVLELLEDKRNVSPHLPE